MPETSVIIRAFNEAEYIGEVLEAVENQNYQDFEIILVDSGSTDGTLEIADGYVDAIEFVSPQNFTFGHSCNVGCEVASGEFCSFLSAHAIPTDEEWLGPMVDNLREDTVAMSYSNQIGAETTKYPERRLFNELFPDERRRQTPPNYWANNASSVLKKELWKNHQFDEYLTGHEDIEWAKHFMDEGYEVIYEPGASIYHIHDESWDQVFNRFEREAIADSEIGIKDRSDRWEEYLHFPIDVIKDTAGAVRDGKLSLDTFAEIVRFRYNQHMGTVSGLRSERDLEEDRYEYYYGDANESVYLHRDGDISIEASPLPDVKPNDVLIKTKYIGVQSDFVRPAEKDKYPIIPTGNYVGTVVELGANANSVDVGDVVVGETRFHCGVCDACSNGDHLQCEQPTILGVDTDYGAYSRYMSIPSDYVYPLPDGIEPRKGTLARLAATISDKVDRMGSETDGDENCVVVGQTANAKFAVQIIETVSELSVTRLSETDVGGDSEQSVLGQYDVVVEAVGTQEMARECIRRAKSGSTILLLGSQYDPFELNSHDVIGKSILNGEQREFVSCSDYITVLSEIDVEEIIDGTYELPEFKSALKAIREFDKIPIIEINHSD